MNKRFQRLSTFVLSLGVALPAVAADPLWYNNGVVTTPPQVDAITFVNEGFINILTTHPFETSSTLNYTNKGIMQGSVGFRFNLNPPTTGVPGFSRNFHNRVGGVIASSPSLISITPEGYVAPNYLYVDSTNMLNRGLITIEAGGEMILRGGDVDLSFGGTGVSDVSTFGIGSVNNSPDDGFFLPDLAIGDNYWGSGTNGFDSEQIIQQIGPFLLASSPTHFVQTLNLGFLTSLAVFDPVTSAYTNLVGGRFITITNMDATTTNFFVITNITRQAVFVGVNSDYQAEVRYFPSSRPTNFFQTVAVELSTPITNALTAEVEQATLYFVDDLASETNQGVLTNYVEVTANPGLGTARPASYLLSRLPVLEFELGALGNATITNTFLYDPATFTNNIVTGAYSAYSAEIDSLISRPPPVEGGTVTNLSGRVKVQSDGSLNLNYARLQAAGLMTIETPHLLTSANAIVEAENLSFSLGRTNGPLLVQDLMNETVFRMIGDVAAWSSVWTNTATEVYDSYTIDTNDGSATLTPFTNAVRVGLHALIVDATGLGNTVPVAVHDLRMSSTDVVFEDQAQVVEDLVIDADTFTLNGAITLSSALSLFGEAQNWTAATAPTLQHFTNNGRLLVESEAHFGDDRPVPYASFVNRGLIASVGQTVDADYCEITGTNQTQASLNLISRSGKLETALLNVGEDLRLMGDVWRLRDSTLLVFGGLDLSLNAGGALSDTGGGAGNDIVSNDGFRMPVKPATGDLLGTTLHSVSPALSLVNHVWAGEDRGATTNGYTDNVAIGVLSLEPDSTLSFFEFAGVGSSNGLYVDLLDLSLLPQYQSRLIISPNLTLYFAVAEGVPEEQLDGALNGRLRWVKDFAGPNSSVEVLLPDGTTGVFNRALRESLQIDSDNDGLANGYDPTPFPSPNSPLTISQFAVSAAPPGQARISWMAAPSTTYTVEYSTTARPNDWHHLLSVTNASAERTELTVNDPDPIGGVRYYRVFFMP